MNKLNVKEIEEASLQLRLAEREFFKSTLKGVRERGKRRLILGWLGGAFIGVAGFIVACPLVHGTVQCPLPFIG